MVDDSTTPRVPGEPEALRRLAAFRGRLGPELGAAFDAFAARLKLFRGDDEHGYFSHPMALPVLELPQWAVAHTARRGRTIAPAVAASLGEAAAMGYLHVRVQDDWFDEAVGDPGTAMRLSDAFFVRHQALLARVVPSRSAFWELFEEVWLGYGEAMLLERRLHKGGQPYDIAAFRRVLTRSRPLALPPAAALFSAHQSEDVELFEQFSAALAVGHQLFADLLHVEKDRTNENRTHVLFRLGAKSGGEREAQALRVALFSRGGFDTIVSDALKELAQARSAAEALGVPEATRFCDERARYMAQVQRKVFEALFSGFRRGREGTPPGYGSS
jgi:hypothetical protein